MKNKLFWKISLLYSTVVLISIIAIITLSYKQIYILSQNVDTDAVHLSVIFKQYFAVSSIIIAMTLLITLWVVSRTVIKPIKEMEKTAFMIARGDFLKRVDVKRDDEIGALGKAFNIMADELEIKIENMKKMDLIRKDFVANVSHELKTPLTSIKGYVETLQDGAIDDKVARQKFLTVIKKNSDRLSSIINDLLILSGIEGKTQELDVALFDIKTLVDEVVWSFEPISSSRQQSIHVYFHGTDFTVYGEKRKIEQVFINLIDNAIKYTKNQGEIKLYIFEKKDSVMSVIEDSGIGIPKGHLDRVFERFYRVDKARSRELGGTGLGLAIVKHIVLMHKGHIDIESEVDRGTKITVILPKRSQGCHL